MIKINSKENSFLNSWFESPHKRVWSIPLEWLYMQVLNTRIWKESLAPNKVKIEILFLILIQEKKVLVNEKYYLPIKMAS